MNLTGHRAAAAPTYGLYASEGVEAAPTRHESGEPNVNPKPVAAEPGRESVGVGGISLRGRAMRPTRLLEYRVTFVPCTVR